MQFPHCGNYFTSHIPNSHSVFYNLHLLNIWESLSGKSIQYKLTLFTIRREAWRHYLYVLDKNYVINIRFTCTFLTKVKAKAVLQHKQYLDSARS